jgi:hypothetical protein
VPRAAGTMALTPADPRVGAGAGSDPAGRRSRRLLGWLVAFILAAGAAFVVLRLLTPGDGTQVPPRTWAWTGDGLVYQVVRGGQPRGDLVLWLYVLLTQVVYVMGWAGLAAFVVLFPRPWTPLTRHRRLLPVVCAGPVVLAVALALAALGGVGLTQWVGRVIATETFVSIAALGTGIVLAMARYLTATDPIGRQQLKWLASGAFVSGTLALVVWFLPQLLFGNGLLPEAWLGFSGLPLLAGLTVAVLRYRLFDVDRIISRTVAYGLLTLLLGGGYAAVVLGLGRLLPQGSSLGVAAATLAVAAVFQPARRRIQRVVDRRFNRRHHDTTQTVAAFSARLRDQVDLDTLSAELLAVAEQTMQPTQVSLWLRPQPGRLAHPTP